MLRAKTMPTTLLATAFVLFIIAFAAWWYLLFGRPNPSLRRADISITSASSTATASPSRSAPGTDQLNIDGAMFNVEVASTSLEQTRGLSYRASLGENDGMLFVFSTGTIQTFWMKDMNFPLDMIWISGNTVVGFEQDAPAPGTQLWQLPIYASPDRTDKVLEVNAGTVAKYNIKVGDVVMIGLIK